MALTFPTTGFTGTEVEAFETAYKELAEEIYDAYEKLTVNTSVLKAPYKSKNNIKLFLEYGLLYAAFIVKQRAGNAGPGTNYDFSGSPKMIEVPPEDTDWLMERMGCIMEKEAIYAWLNENDVGDNPRNPCNIGITTTGSSMTIGPNTCRILEDLLDDIMNDGGEDGCNDFSQKWENPSGGGPDAPAEMWQAMDAIFEGLGWIADPIPAETPIIGGGEYSKLRHQMHRRYMGGSGNTHTTNDMYPGDANAIRKEIGTYMNNQYSKVTELTLTESERTAHGMQPGERIYIVEFEGALNPILGGARVITDGNETGNPGFPIDASWSISTSNILNVRDDYDFKYGWEIERDGTGTVMGDEFTDSMIREGINWTTSGPDTVPPFQPDATPNTNAGICETIIKSKNDHGWKSFVPRYTVASIKGQGSVSTSIDQTTGKGNTGTWKGEDSGKPFAVNWSWR